MSNKVYFGTMIMHTTKRIQSPEDMGRLIRDRRRELGLTQEVLYLLTGVTQAKLSKIERGQSAASLDTYLRIFNGLGIDLLGVPRR
jgi:HTH-type transcriptional regulator/antitoxin HipB